MRMIIDGALVVSLILLVAVCSGCDSVSSPAVPAACSKIGEQCQRPEGPLGVCQAAPCAAGKTPPCFKCTSQH